MIILKQVYNYLLACTCNHANTWECKSRGEGKCNCKPGAPCMSLRHGSCDPDCNEIETTSTITTETPITPEIKIGNESLMEPMFCSNFSFLDCRVPGGNSQCPITCNKLTTGNVF